MSPKLQIKGTANLQTTPDSKHATCPCGAWRGELGSEPEPALFIEHLVEVFDEVRRVLRPDGGSGKPKPPFAVTARHSGRPAWVPGSVTAGHGGTNSKQYVYGLEDACELQGLPRDFCEHMPFTKEGKLKAIANGVPIPMGRAIARAVRRVIQQQEAAA